MITLFDIDNELISFKFLDFSDALILLKKFLELVSDLNKVAHNFTLEFVFSLFISFVKICNHEFSDGLELIVW